MTYVPPSGAPKGGGAVAGKVPLDLAAKYTQGPGAANRSPRMDFMNPNRNPLRPSSGDSGGVLGATGRNVLQSTRKAAGDGGPSSARGVRWASATKEGDSDKWSRDRLHVAAQQSKASLASLEAMLHKVEGDLQQREEALGEPLSTIQASSTP